MRKYLNNLTVEMLQKERDELLGTTVSDIRALAPYVKAVTDNGSICVIGGEETIMENSDLFKNLVNLL